MKSGRRDPGNSDLLAVKVAAAVFVLSGLFAHAQVTSGSPSRTVVGTVDSVSGNTIRVLSGADVFLLKVDGERSMLWKGRVIHDLSLVHAGDTITARCRWVPSGDLSVESLWLNIVTFFGTISKVTPGAVEVLMNPNADPQSAYKRELRTVAIDADTAFEASAPDDLKQGRGIQIVGTILGGRRVLASKVVVYEGDRPVRMRPSTLIAPNGRSIDK